MHPEGEDLGGGYLLDNAKPEAGDRFAAMAELFDPWTFAHLDRIGVGPGWRVWEVGAGAPGVPGGLAARVGPGGQVLATDIDTGLLGAGTGATAGAGSVEVRVHDVSKEPPPPGGWDLVHARLVLVHLADRDDALAAMVAALRPGGWLLVEDADPALQPLACPDERTEAEALANRLRRGFRTLLAGRGANLAYGRTLPRLLRSAGLEGVTADCCFPIASDACVRLEAATMGHIRGQLVAAGLATDPEIDTHLANVAAGGMDLASAPLVSAWGRKPP